MLTKENFAQRYPGLAPATYAALRLWLDQLDARSYGSTQYWNDLSGLGNHFEQATVDNQPSIAGPSRVFDGTNDYLAQSPVYSNASIACTIVLTAGSASLLVTGVSLTPYDGKFVRVYDGAKYAWGYISTGAGPIVSTVGGATQNWTDQEVGFNTGAATFKVEIFPPGLNILGALTILAWVKTGSSNTQGVVNKWFESSNSLLRRRSWSLTVKGGSGVLRFLISDTFNGAFLVDGSAVVTTDTWVQVGARFVPSTSIQNYVNGVADGSPNTTSIPAALYNTRQEVWVGAGITDGSPYVPFVGSIAQVMIFAGALSAAEIRRIYLRDLPRYQVA